MLVHESMLFLILGIPTWTLVDGTWSALSQLANTVPEGYEISAYLILALTVGNIVPLFLGIALRKRLLMSLRSIVRIILVSGFVAGILLSQFWNKFVSIDGHKLSLPLFLLFFLVGACSSASNVTHFTFVSQYPAVSTSALATGMGIGSMVSGLLAILQGTVLSGHGFTVGDFYIVLSLLYIPAFVVLTMIKEPTAEHDAEEGRSSDNHNSKDGEVMVANFLHSSSVVQLDSSGSGLSATTPDNEHLLINPNSPSLKAHYYSDSTAGSNSRGDDAAADHELQFLREYYPVLAVQMFNASLGYGLVPAMVSTACSKFNNRSLVLLLATGLTAAADPLCKALTAVIRIETLLGLQVSSLCLALLTAGLVLCVSLPSSLPMYSGAGGVLPVTLYVAFGALFGFSNTCVYRHFKQHVSVRSMQHSYRWGGMATQCGALVGSLIAFSVIISHKL